MITDNIKNLLFDLGGVIMDLRRQNAVEALKELGMSDADDFLGLYGQKGPFLAIEKGLVSPAQFRDTVREMIGRPDLSDRQLDNAFNRFLVGIPVTRLRQLEELRKKFRVYLLSNTNPIMWNSKIAAEFAKDGHDVNYYFDGIVTSFESHLYKPDPDIFLEVLRKFNIIPEETLFFDDSSENVEAARKLGFKAVHVIPGTEFISYIQ